MGTHNCLDGSVMIQLNALNDVCRGAEDSFDNLLMIWLGALYGNR